MIDNYNKEIDSYNKEIDNYNKEIDNYKEEVLVPYDSGMISGKSNLFLFDDNWVKRKNQMDC